MDRANGVLFQMWQSRNLVTCLIVTSDCSNAVKASSQAAGTENTDEHN